MPGTLIKQILRDESGATAIEYGLIVALICIGAMATFQQLGAANSAGLKASLTKISDAINAVP